MGLPTTAEREAMYQRIFAGIPRSFLDPKHPNNRAVIGAIAYLVAYAENLYEAFERGLFLDTVSDADADDSQDGLTSIQRWITWLKMEQRPDETADQFRARIQQRLFAPKLTIEAIETAVSSATGLVTYVEEPADQLVEMNAGPWAGKRLVGNRFGYMSIDVVTLGATNATAEILPQLRAGGVHWRHLEIVSSEIALTLEAGQSSVTLGRDQATLWRDAFRPNTPLTPNAHPLNRQRLSHDTVITGLNERKVRHGGIDLLVGPPGALIETVEASFVPPLPELAWDDADTLWDESVWSD